MHLIRPALLLAALIGSASTLQAKDGHGNHAAASSSYSGYKSDSRTYYSYTPPKVMSPPRSAYAPVKTSSGETGKLMKSAKDAAGTRMSKDWNSKVDQGVAKAKTWSKQASRVTK